MQMKHILEDHVKIYFLAVSQKIAICLQWASIFCSSLTFGSSRPQLRNRLVGQEPSPIGFNRFNHVDSSESNVTCKNLDKMLVYFQLEPKNYIQGNASLAAFLQWHVINFISCVQMLHCLNYHEFLALWNWSFLFVPFLTGIEQWARLPV